MTKQGSDKSPRNFSHNHQDVRNTTCLCEQLSSIISKGCPFATLVPDGEATGCNPVEVGSIPTGVFSSLQRLVRLGPWRGSSINCRGRSMAEQYRPQSL